MGVYQREPKLKKSLDKPSKVSAAAHGNVPLRETEFVWEFKRDIIKAVEVGLSTYESIRLSAHIVKIFIFLSDSIYHPMNFCERKIRFG